MVEQPPSDAIPYRKVFETLSAIAGILALPYAVSLPLRDFRWVENQYSAGIMILIAILTSLLFLAGVEAFQRWLKVPGLEVKRRTWLCRHRAWCSCFYLLWVFRSLLHWTSDFPTTHAEEAREH